MQENLFRDSENLWDSKISTLPSGALSPRWTGERGSHVQKRLEWSKQRPSALPEVKFKSSAVQGMARKLFTTTHHNINTGTNSGPSEAGTAI